MHPVISTMMYPDSSTVRTLVVVAAIAVFSPRTPASVITPTGSDRFVSVTNRENLPVSTVSFTGPTLGNWDATAYKANLTSSDLNYNTFGSALAVTSSQHSVFNSGGMSVSAFTNLDYQGIVPPNNGGSITNRCILSFHVGEPCDYQFAVNYIAFQTSIETAWSVTLTQGAVTILSQPANASFNGTLQPGDYQFRVQVDAESGGAARSFDSRLQIDASLTVPAPIATATLLPLGIVAARRKRR